MKRLLLTLVLPCSTLLACSDDGENDGNNGNGSSMVDMGDVTMDMGTPMPPVGVCPDPQAINDPMFMLEDTCTEQSDCFLGNDDFLTERDCEFCVPFAPLTQCSYYECERTPDANTEDQVIAANITVTTPQVANLSHMVLVAVQQETAGGTRLTCEDDVAPNPTAFALDNPCYNVLDVDLFEADNVVAGGGDTFLLQATRFSNDRDVMFLVYGFDNPRAQGVPIGVYCTEVSFGPDTPEAVPVGNSAPSFSTMLPLP
ncbi:MAG: hypothetical protein AAGJ19_10110 [Myxococcota bacterium]